jgi:hypothetical protein
MENVFLENWSVPNCIVFWMCEMCETDKILKFSSLRRSSSTTGIIGSSSSINIIRSYKNIRIQSILLLSEFILKNKGFTLHQPLFCLFIKEKKNEIIYLQTIIVLSQSNNNILIYNNYNINNYNFHFLIMIFSLQYEGMMI